MKNLTIEELLNRVRSPISLNELAQEVISNFHLGKFILFKPLLVGYEELNCFLETSRGKFIVKIFSKNKNFNTIFSNVTALLEYFKGGIPVPKLYSHKKDKYLYQVFGSKTFLVVMDYFDGKKFTELDPTLKDFKNIAKILAKINKLRFRTNANYDIWLTVHLTEEFKKKKKYLSKENLRLVKPVVEEFKRIDYSKLTKSIVHFDLHRENVMKDSNGKYCILDLACTDFNYRVFDVATFVALFCFDGKLTLIENLEIYDKVINAYLSESELSDYELVTLPLLIKGTFASNLLIPEYLQKSGQDENPGQTAYYKSLGKRGLELLKDIDKF